MTRPPSPVLEFPAMLHGSATAIHRKMRAEGHEWAREYLQTGTFTQPRRMRQVEPGEVLVMDSVAVFDVILRPRWRVYLFGDVFTGLNDVVPEEERQRTEDAFESFCLSTPWGTLFHVVSPYPPQSSERMARRLAALLRFWDVLQGLRYTFWSFTRECTLEELMDYLYRKTLEAWCPGGPASVREHLALAVERMARATRQDCLEAVLRVIPGLVNGDTDLKHHEVLSDPDFLRERLAALPSKDFESLSSAYVYSVAVQLTVWDSEMERQ